MIIVKCVSQAIRRDLFQLPGNHYGDMILPAVRLKLFDKDSRVKELMSQAMVRGQWPYHREALLPGVHRDQVLHLMGCRHTIAAD